MSEFFKLRKVGWLTPTHQIILLVLAYLGSVYYFRHATNWYVIFAPLYEEVIFRGFVLGGLLALYNKRTSIWLSAFLFGIWHLKNLTSLSTDAVLYQVAYAGLILGPLLAWLTLKTKSIWLGVMIHALNNILLSPMSWWVVGMLGYKSLF